MDGQDGVYCSTAGAYFQERQSLHEHYQSEFHRYNLKRKVAGLPPVTKEWFDARRQQLSVAASGPLQRIWFDPLAKKKFYSENTYQAFTRSKKYQELVRKSGQPAPSAVVSIRRLDEASSQQTTAPQPQSAARASKQYTVKPAVKGGPFNPAATLATQSERERGVLDGTNSGAESESEWETASEEEEAMETEAREEESWEEWDVRCSLFDGHVSPSMEANLEYMWRKFGFYLPDSEYLQDPEGLLKYLGAKLQYGHVPLYESGDNPNARQFGSLHAVQRHMVDSGRCKMLYDDNEDEYADFYQYGDDVEEEEDDLGGHVDGETRQGSSNALIVGGSEGIISGAAGQFELAVPSASTGGVKMLGTREFARYYRQRHRLGDQRDSAVAARVVAQYRRLAVPLLGDGSEDAEERKRAQRGARRAEKQRLAMSMRRNVNDNLPRNVPY